MEKGTHSLRYLLKSKFLRSISLQVLSIFLIVSIAIIAIVFFSFASEINRNIISDRQKQLAVIEDTITKRMEEISSIAYHVGVDPTFYLEPVQDAKYSGYEMSNALSKYLIGNSFIQYLAYHRLSEPDKLYTSRGELSFSDFWSTYLNVDRETAQQYIQGIQSTTQPRILALSLGEGRDYVAYTCPLPQFSAKPQAFVLMLIPISEVSPLLESQLMNSSGAIAVFDADGNEIYRASTLEAEIPIDPATYGATETYLRANGSKYVVQKQVSSSNGWSYISVIRLRDIISGLASKQLEFILLLLVLMLVALFAMLVCIFIQYRPISKLVVAVSDEPDGATREIIDEQAFLSSRIATLKDDSEQKAHFETAYYAAEAANKAKSAFLSSVSHDIRTPMNAIIGMTAIAYKHSDDPESVRECLQKVQVASEYLLDIINNVLDMSRIESGRFELLEETVALPKLTYGLMAILSQSLRAKRQTLTVALEDLRHELIIGDGVRLSQIFMNILSNSVKFTPEGGTLRLHMRELPSDRPGCGEYVFTFSDTGIGMPPEFVAHVFDTFSRAAESNVSRVEGTGLGMAIAKNLVELMGGSIRCESTLGSGTTFTVSLSLRLAEAEAAEECAPEAYGDMRVLILQQDEHIRAAEARAFAEAGVRAPVCAASASEAASLLREAGRSGIAFRLAVISPSDGDARGIRAAAELSDAAEGADTAFVLAVQDPMDIQAAEAKRAGFDTVVPLPLFRSAVIRLLERAFGQPETAPSAQSTPNLTGKHVLIAEDNAINREIARRMIAETHAETVEAENGAEAVRLFSSRPAGTFDVILMDLQMPVLNGYEATASIRALDREDARTVPIYALTASTFDEDVRQVREAGMNGHIGKPYTAEALYGALRQAIPSRQQ